MKYFFRILPPFFIFLFCFPFLVFSLFKSLEEALPFYTLGDNIVKHFSYILSYNDKTKQSNWVTYFLTKESANGTISRTNRFRPDPLIPLLNSASLNYYKGSGYDRGHLAPAGDMKWSVTAMSESFFLSNISPQAPGFNRGIWKNLEEQVRTWATENEELYIVTGPVLSEKLSTIGVNRVAVPQYFYKVMLDYKLPEYKGIGFIMPNQSSRVSLQHYAVTIDSIEIFTGFDFFPALPDSLENQLESTLDLKKWFVYEDNQSSSTTGMPQVGQTTIPDSNQIESKNLTVYITKTGKKYHRDGCRSLSKSKIPISLKEAVLSYGPCNVCNPPIIQQSTISKPSTEENKSVTVYVTRTGSKYHRAGCRSLKRSSIPMSLEDAKQRYSPCGICNPPN